MYHSQTTALLESEVGDILRAWCKTIVTSCIKWGSYNSFAPSPGYGKWSKHLTRYDIKLSDIYNIDITDWVTEFWLIWFQIVHHFNTYISSYPTHTFSRILSYQVHIPMPITDNCRLRVKHREKMAIEINPDHYY